MYSRTNHYFWIFFKSLGASVAIVVGINLATLLLGLMFYGFNEEWGFQFRHLVFTLNDREMGLKFFEAEANGLMMIFFIAAVAQEFKKPLISNQTNDENVDLIL